jgi:hypothetical protein
MREFALCEILQKLKNSPDFARGCVLIFYGKRTIILRRLRNRPSRQANVSA